MYVYIYMYIYVAFGHIGACGVTLPKNYQKLCPKQKNIQIYTNIYKVYKICTKYQAATTRPSP